MLLNAIKLNEKYQKKNRLKKYTKPELFYNIERFMLSKKLIGYGGMAINILLPKEKQFYEYIDVPDYDFFSPNAKNDAVELSIILSKTYNEIEVEVKSGMNEGTFKIFVNFIPIVDITQIDNELYHNLLNNAIYNKGIYYAPYNYLRMSMYLELSRPLGDITRWEKVYKRLQLLNQSHPLILRTKNISFPSTDSSDFKENFNTLMKKIEKTDSVLLGNYAMYYYQDFFPTKYRTEQQPILFLLTQSTEKILKMFSTKSTKIKKYTNKFIEFYEIFLDGIPTFYVIQTDSCQSYNVIDNMKIATIDTMLSIYYAMSFFNEINGISRIQLLTYCYLLHQIENKGDTINEKDEKNDKNKVLKRFNMPCIGTQLTIEDIKHEKNIKYKIYRKTGKFRDLFFRFDPTKKRTKKLKIK
jgi:hypothetical protein